MILIISAGSGVMKNAWWAIPPQRPLNDLIWVRLVIETNVECASNLRLQFFQMKKMECSIIKMSKSWVQVLRHSFVCFSALHTGSKSGNESCDNQMHNGVRQNVSCRIPQVAHHSQQHREREPFQRCTQETKKHHSMGVQQLYPFCVSLMWKVTSHCTPFKWCVMWTH